MKYLLSVVTIAIVSLLLFTSSIKTYIEKNVTEQLSEIKTVDKENIYLTKSEISSEVLFTDSKGKEVDFYIGDVLYTKDIVGSYTPSYNNKDSKIILDYSGLIFKDIVPNLQVKIKLSDIELNNVTRLETIKIPENSVYAVGINEQTVSFTMNQIMIYYKYLIALQTIYIIFITGFWVKREVKENFAYKIIDNKYIVLEEDNGKKYKYNYRIVLNYLIVRMFSPVYVFTIGLTFILMFLILIGDNGGFISTLMFITILIGLNGHLNLGVHFRVVKSLDKLSQSNIKKEEYYDLNG